MFKNFRENLKDIVMRLIKSRVFLLFIVIVVLFVTLVHHLFSLQIIKGEEYQTSYTASIRKELSIEGIRGNIYDKNGILLAYNELSYNVTIEDSGTYESTDAKNKALNAEADKLIDLLEKNGDTIVNEYFYINVDPVTESCSFTVAGTTLQRFRADVYGRAKIEDLRQNDRLGYHEASATPEQIYDYLIDQFGINKEEYSVKRLYQIMVIRYSLLANSYQKYVAVSISRNVSDETVVAVREHAGELEGVEVLNSTRRVYTDAPYYSSIIGYVGRISIDEYDQLIETDDTYTLSDQVGKTGIEKYMESSLKGKKGVETVLVNNVGKIQSVLSKTDSSVGNDVYLSIDSRLQAVVYQLLEQEIAGILYESIRNTKTVETGKKDEIYTPVYDVYAALLTNNVVDTTRLPDAKKNSSQAKIYAVFASEKDKVLDQVSRQLSKSDRRLSDTSEAMQAYLKYIVTDLQKDNVFDASAVDSADEVYRSWKNGETSISEYLKHAINQGWIDSSLLNIKKRYSDTNEVYEALVAYILDHISDDHAFHKLIYRYLVLDDRISPRRICLALYEQGVLKKDEAYSDLKSDQITPYEFVKKKIKNLEITPARLGLKPCSGSCVIMNPNDGTVLACVSYPGYDSNRLSNADDSAYYNQLLEDSSLPLYNYATQQTTAPGSTFKLLTAVAGCNEQVITPDTVIEDKGRFNEVGMNLRCWIYPGTHGKEKLAKAIKDSCNYYFCEVGYRLSLKNGSYNEKTGLDNIKKYATLFGLSSKTGVEIAESKSKVATELPVSAAIGQSNNAYNTAQLARYVSAVANRGNVYQMTLLSRETDAKGKVVRKYSPKISHSIDNVSEDTWNTITRGMQAVVRTHDQFDEIKKVRLAGKTGTAQEAKQPNHALFVGYAPYDNPQISIAARIANGYSSGNACDLVARIMKYYYQLETEETLLNGQAVSGSTSNSVND